MKKNKVIILASIIVGVLVVTLGLTYAVLSFNETKGNSKLVLGDIWMHYNESDTSINITDMMPSDEYTNDYFEFTIDGKNTYDKKDIWYEIVLSHGEYEGDDENRTIRIDDQLLKFKLVEVVDGEEVEIFKNRTYSDLTNKRVHVDTIGADDNNYSKTYRLYMRVAEYTTICGGDATDGCDYYLNPDEEYANLDWDKLFASIKVNVSGDFEEKSIETAGSCFTYEVTVAYEANPVMASQETNELSKCIATFFSEPFDEGSDAESYCRGTGTAYGSTLQEEWNTLYQQEWFREGMGNELINSNIMILENGTYVVNPIMVSQEVVDNELLGCMLFYTDMGYSFEEGSDSESFCKGIGRTWEGLTIQQDLEVWIQNSKELNQDFLKNGGQYLLDVGVIIGNDEAMLTNYDESCGLDVVIPKQIDGYNITRINNNELKCVWSYGTSSIFPETVKNVILQDNITTICSEAFISSGLKNIEISDSVTTIGPSAFKENQLTSIEIPNSVTEIGEYAFSFGTLRNINISNSLTEIGEWLFYGNQLTSIEIPNSVTTIGYEAFSNNKLETVTIGNGIQYIDTSAFEKSSTSNPNLQSITFTSKTCEEIVNITESSTSTNKWFPWLYGGSPYYKEGYKASIFGTDGECVY